MRESPSSATTTVVRDSGPVADRYHHIDDYGIVGNCFTAALISRTGSIDWACFPRFDSPSVFARILDADKGGYWQIAPAGSFTSSRAYLDDTNVLTTTFATETGAAELVDFMPSPSLSPDRVAHNAIVRIIRGKHGQVDLRVWFEPRFDYARATTVWTVEPGCGVQASSGSASLKLHATVPFQIVGTAAEASFRVGADEEIAFLLTYRSPASLLWLGEIPDRANRLLEETATFWRNWIRRCTYHGAYAKQVCRSALVLKLLDYVPTGAIIAAPTTSLPEQIGGTRNWDYRYSWLRDSAFTLYALNLLGYREEGESFLGWVMETAQGDPAALQVLYGVGGERQIEEFDLPHLDGYRGSRPVRVGNAAYTQQQHDIYAEVLDAAFLLHKYGEAISQELWSFLRATVDHVCRIWTEPDQGIWEVRSGPQHFVYSKALCWVAVDRGIRIAQATRLPADLTRWEAVRTAIHEELLRLGYDEEIGSFVQTYGSKKLDASALAMVLRKVLPASDPRMRATVDRIATHLSQNGLIRRYEAEFDDGLAGSEGAFLMCSFWLVDCYAEMGRLTEARALFERLLGYANDLGLYAEQVDPETGHHLGNFPQGFTHVALINAATNLAKAEAAIARQQSR